MKQMMEQIKSAKSVIVFGAGAVGKSTVFILQNMGITVEKWFDNDSLKCTGERIFSDYFCEKPTLVDKNIPILIAVGNIEIRKEMREQCEKLGYQNIYELDDAYIWSEIDSLPDKEYLELQYLLRIGKELNIRKPKTFNEKLQWLKLYDRNPLYNRMTDKVEAKEYVAGVIGEQYIIPTLGIWDTFEEVDFEYLPDQFVLKCTHDSGSASVIFNRSKMDLQSLKVKYERALHTNHYDFGREWVYRDIKPRIIAEKYIGSMNNNGDDLVDYKLMCFNGKVRCSFTCTERFSGVDGLKVTFYDTDWKRMPFERHYASDEKDVPKPACYDEMVRLAERLAKDIPFARIDFYEVDNHPYFGEITLYPGSGFEEFTPSEWDRKLGDWLELPKYNDN